VEVFSSQGAAVARQKYIEQIAKAAPVLANGYDYVYGPVLARVTGKLNAERSPYRDGLGLWRRPGGLLHVARC
jgi:hypothetical protein